MKKVRRDPSAAPSDWFFIGQNIRRLRKKRGLTQTALGKNLTRRKLSRQAITWIESGRNTDLETIADIAATLGVDVETVARRDERDLETLQRDGVTVKHALPDAAERPQISLDVNDLLSRPKRSWKSRIRDNQSLSGSTLGELLIKAREQFDNDPRRARDIGKLSLHVLTLLDASNEQVDPDMRVQAFRDAAWSSIRVGEPDQATKYLAHADQAATACEDEQHQKAIVDLMRSILLWSMERYTEAREPLVRARTILKECGDRRRYLLTLHQEAMIEAKIGDPARAGKIIDDIEVELVSLGNESDIAPMYTVGMYAWSRAGDAERALGYGRKAAEINLRTGNVAEIARDVWRHATVLAQLGDFEAAFSEFEAARQKLLDLDLPHDVLYLDFYVLRAKAAVGADAAELHALCSRLATAASAAQLPFTACEAIDWLRRISARLTTDEIDMVQSLVTENNAVNLFL